MKTTIITGILFALFIVIFGCKSEKKESKITNDYISQNLVRTDSTAQKLFNQKCMICHNTEGKTDETMLAPPFYQVKNRYQRASLNQADFVETMSNWIKNPIKENALMRGAVDKLNVMPKLGYNDEDIKTIVNYIYNNDMPKPDWFDAHQKSHQMNKKGQGRGNGRGQGQGRGNGNGKRHGQGGRFNRD
jgi:mono/diheme cytochrome c family protein